MSDEQFTQLVESLKRIECAITRVADCLMLSVIPKPSEGLGYGGVVRSAHDD
jgi:hypothetical protein